MTRLGHTVSRGACCLALLVLLIGSGGCQTLRRALRPTPDAGGQEPAPVTLPAEPAAEAPAPPTETAPPEPVALPEPAVPPAEGAPRPEAEPRSETESPVAAEPSPPAEPTAGDAPAVVEPETAPKAPAAKPAAPRAGDAPATGEDAPAPQLLEGTEQPSQPALEARLAEADRLSVVLRGRAVSAGLRAQIDSGRVFLEDARQALALRDLKRTQVLLDKCLALLADAESASRP